ncbi:hypothetical protein P4645_08725 [Lysinibacillus fusiformis]|uniref:hypothetical protein n=1 Tax=Lysinibacillus fusiformis TaxID=28031 RepID=UPI0000F38FAF|nr:hypothetical protein [Lysinibacillus fusiformis]EAZ84556.1 hypothetical protein BB14905_21433 [Bacillus sp. B14905]MED4076329.1 hypothetical protein [Lysinibacillus fusiformis]
MNEQFLIDQMIIHVGHYKKHTDTENAMGFYRKLEELRKLKNFNTQDDALYYVIVKMEEAKAA